MSTPAAPSPGLFLSFEGGDGAGKSTQARLLGEWLARELGLEVVLTREPGGTALGRSLRELVLHGADMDPRTEALLYAADRANHVAEVVRPALARGAVVITDRYLDSSLAYQAGGRELDGEAVRALQMWAVAGLLPRLTFLLDLDPARLPERLTGAPDRLERAGAEFHTRTRAAYLALARRDPQRWRVLDADRPIEAIQADVRGAVGELVRGVGA